MNIEEDNNMAANNKKNKYLISDYKVYIIVFFVMLLLTVLFIMVLWLTKGGQYGLYYSAIGGLLGGLIGGIGTLIAVVITTQETRRIQDKDNKRVEKEYKIRIINDKLENYQKIYLLVNDMNKILYNIMIKLEEGAYIGDSNIFDDDVLEYIDLTNKYVFMISLVEEEHIRNDILSIKNVENELKKVSSMVLSMQTQPTVNASQISNEQALKIKECISILRIHGDNIINCSHILNKDKYNL